MNPFTGRPVELGLRSGADVEVLSGLSTDDLIIVKGANNLLPNQAVETITPVKKS